MGKKKSRNPTSQKKCEPPSSATPETQLTGVSSTAAVVAAIKQECDRALNALRRGNPTKALKVLKEATVKFQKEALFHRYAGRVIVKAAGYIDDPTVMLRHLKTAVDYARNAVSLSPNSAEFACFYATLLLDIANEPRDYDRVVAECERALALKNPNDPATEDLVSDDTVSFTAEAKEVRIELKNVLQRANIANISAWMKNIGGGDKEEDMRKLVPMVRRARFDDDGQLKYVSDSGTARPPPRPKKKTLEERRKEIEFKVATARLMQQTTEEEDVGESNRRDCGEEASCSGSGSGSGSTSPTLNYGEWRRFSSFGAMPPFSRG